MFKHFLPLLTALTILLIGCSEEESTVPIENGSQLTSTEVTTEVETEEPAENEEPTYEGPTSVTTGLPVTEEEAGHVSFTTMIENSPNARPQSGLTDADIVYEIEVEGNITRFLALFHDDVPDTVGPIRSSRHYFLPIAESWEVPYIHFGGSPQAYSALSSLSVPTVDGIYQGKYFERDHNRFAPHNAYLKTNQIDTTEQSPKNEKFIFDKDASYENSLTSSRLDITYNGFTHVAYEYDGDSNVYHRFLEEEPHVDRETNEQIKANNVILLYAAHQVIPGDDKNRIDITLTGEGEADFFLDGQVIKGTWKNEGNNLRFYADSELLSLNPGKTWIQVINKYKKDIVSY